MRRLARTWVATSLFLGVSIAGLGQSVTLSIGSASGTAGGSVSLPINLTSSGGALTAGLQWSFAFSADITGVTVVAGPAANNAGKSITCLGNNCLLLGFNNTAMADGTVATATFQIAANPSTTTIPVQITGVVASTAAGDSIPASGGSGTITVPAPPPVVSVGLSPSSASLTASQSKQFTATVTGNANTSVTWSMSPSVGTLVSGLYTAPSVVNTAQSVTVTATSVADPSKSASATVQLTPPGSVSVVVSPSNATLSASQAQQLTATVTGNANTSVTWSMAPSIGSLVNGLYTAPSAINSPQSVTVTATSVADSSKSASAVIQLAPAGVSVSLSPSTATLAPTQSLQFTAKVTGNSNTAITWSMTPSVGTLSNGLYTAPATAGSTQSVTVTATSVADSSKSASVSIVLVPDTSNISIRVSPSSATLGPSQGLWFTATVSGTSDSTVTWSNNGGPGTMSPTGQYTAPATISEAQRVTITATLMHSLGAQISASAVLNLLPNNNSSTAPVVTSVTNGASLAGGPVSPGEIITIQGSGLSSDDSTTFAVDATGMLAKTLGNSQVLFDGAPAALLYARSNQINLIVPYSVIPGTSVNISAEYQGVLSNPISVPVVAASPGVFTAGGQNQAAIINRDRTINSPGSPAAAGDVVTIYATGAGQTIPPGIDGQIEGATPVPILPVSVKIGGLDSLVLSANLTGGMLVITAKVPATAPSGSAVPLVLAVGNAVAQSGVVMSIQ